MREFKPTAAPKARVVVATTLLISALTSAAVATANTFVAVRLLQRKSALHDDGSLFALRCFSLWWAATALNQFLGAGLYAGAAFGYIDLTVQLTYVVVQRVLLAASLFGLLYYLVFVTSGRRALGLLLVAYGALAVFQLYGVFAGAPDRVIVSRWRTDIAGPADAPAWQAIANAVFLILPPVVASLAYLRVARHLEDRSRRARIFAVSFGITLWWIVAVIAGGHQAFDNDLLQLSNRVIQGAVAIVILAAYRPTAWVQRTFRIEPYTGAS